MQSVGGQGGRNMGSGSGGTASWQDQQSQHHKSTAWVRLVGSCPRAASALETKGWRIDLHSPERWAAVDQHNGPPHVVINGEAGLRLSFVEPVHLLLETGKGKSGVGGVSQLKGAMFPLLCPSPLPPGVGSQLPLCQKTSAALPEAKLRMGSPGLPSTRGDRDA